MNENTNPGYEKERLERQYEKARKYVGNYCSKNGEEAAQEYCLISDLLKIISLGGFEHKENHNLKVRDIVLSAIPSNKLHFFVQYTDVAMQYNECKDREVSGIDAYDGGELYIYVK